MRAMLGAVFVLLTAAFLLHDQLTFTAFGQSVPEGTVPLPPPIVISEFMADNERTLQDGDGDYPDWLELFNAGDASINLEGWTLTDKPHELNRWPLPAITIPAKSYWIVFASDKDRRDPMGELHTNFRLSAGGEFLAIVSPSGQITSAYSPAYPAQFPDTSYGRDGAGNERYFRVPTPGSDNNVAENLGPLILGVNHSPAQLNPGESLRVSASVAPAQNDVVAVNLVFRIDFGPEVSIPMTPGPQLDDGARSYHAEISTAFYEPGSLVRYYVRALDSADYVARWPIFSSPATSPQYQGTLVRNPDVASSLPIFHWFMQDIGGASTDGGGRAAVFYDGVLYDNVFVRLRGDTTTDQPKKSFKFVFNDGYHLRLTPDGYMVDEINVNSNVRDYSHLHQTLAWEAFRDAGTPYSIAFPTRVERNGAFYGIYTLVEQPESQYFERQGLDWQGALYKVNRNDLASHTEGVEKKTRKDEDFSDLQALVDGIHQNEGARTRYLYDNVNLPAVLNFLAVSAVIHDWDFLSKNHYLYRDTRGTGEWMFLPWDKDLTFSRPASDDLNSHPLHGTEAHPAVYVEFDISSWNHLIDALLTTPSVREMYLRRLRSVMDQLLQEPGMPYEQRYFETRVDVLAQQLASNAAVEATTWSPPEQFNTAIAELKEGGIAARRQHLYVTHGPDSPDGIIPAAQPLHPRIHFGDAGAATVTADADIEYFVLVNDNDFAVDISGWRIEGDVTYTFQPGVVIPADGKLHVAKDVRSFRNRDEAPRGNQGLFVQGGYDGSISGHLGDLRLLDKTDTVIDRVFLGFIPRSEIYLPLVKSQLESNGDLPE